MYSLKHIGNKYPNKIFKRIIYIGLRQKPPTSLDCLNNNIESTKTIEEEIIDPIYYKGKNINSLFPILIVWENTIGERFYAEVV